MLRFNLFFAFLALIGSESVLAQVATKSYPPPIQANIAEAKKECLSVGGKSMSVSAEAVMTADVSGDGSSDYFVDWGQFQCNGAASLWCGTAGCPVVAFVAGADKKLTRISIGHIRGYAVVEVDGQTLLQINVHGSACGQAGAYDCVQRLRYVNGKFERFPPPQSPSKSIPAPVVAKGPSWQLMTLKGGQKVAFIRPGGRIPTLSLGCQAGSSTLMVETQPGAVRGVQKVVLRGSDGSTVSADPAGRQGNFLLVRPLSADVYSFLMSQKGSVTLEIGQATMASFSMNGALDALATATAPRKPVGNPTVLTGAPTIKPAVAPNAAGRMGVLGVPIRHGYYVPEYEQCSNTSSVVRFGPNGHAEADASDRRWVDIPWGKATLRRDGYYRVIYKLAPGEVPGDEIEIMIKPLPGDRVEMVVQDNVKLKLCQRNTLPSWVM